MASIITPGDYYIIPANNTNNALDVTGSNFTNTSNIEVWTRLQNDAQIWTVSEREDGTLQIASRFCGKCIDIRNVNISAGTNIQLFDDNDTIAQQWVAAKSSTTVTVDGVTYDTYAISPNSNTSLRMAVVSTAAGANVQLSTSTAANSLWVFMPVPDIRTGGVYEVRTLLNTSNALSVAGSGTANGANVYVTPTSGGNAQKWIVVKEGEVYTLRNVLSNKLLDVDSGKAEDGANVHIWEDNDTRAQGWAVYEYGTTTINGRKCVIVALGSTVTADADTYFLDVSRADLTNGNVWVFSKNATTAQRFALYPTDATDTRMPTPTDLGIAKTSTTPREQFSVCGDDRCITWKSSAAWCADGSNHYEVRMRARGMNSSLSSWNPWSSWTPWNPAVIKRGKQQCWYSPTGAILDDYPWKQFKNYQAEIQVRAAGTNEFNLLVGPSTDAVVSIYREPNVSITAEWNADGLELLWASDYTLGMTYINVSKITSGNKVIFEGTEVLSGSMAECSQVIERGKLSDWIEPGDSITIEYTIGYDQKSDLLRKHTKTTTPQFASNRVNVTPTLTRHGNHLRASVTNLGQTRVFVKCDNELVECPKMTDGTYEILYPTDGREFNVYVESRSTTSAAWGTSITPFSMSTVAYAFTTKNGETLYLGVFYSELPIYAYSNQATYQADKLGARKWESVSFGATNSQMATVTGALIEGKTEETVADFERLVGQHVVFRDIHGGIQNAAVVSIEVARHERFDEVSLEVIRETI